MKIVIAMCLVSSVVSPAWAATTSPYAGQEGREIKALSSQEVSDFLEGKGMGYAKAAELNNYPGPRHVLDLADPLELTPQQIAKTESNFDNMKRAAVDLGKSLIDKEKEIDDLFSTGRAQDAVLRPLLARVGELQSQIRFVHLQAHLRQKEILTAMQIQRYNHLRGYGRAMKGEDHHHAH